MLGLACRSSSRQLLQDAILLPLASFLEAGGPPVLAQQQPTPDTQGSAQHSSYSTHAARSSSSRKRSSKGHVPRLPSSIDWEQSSSALQQQRQQKQASLARQQQLPQIPEGELLALIVAASSISDIERLVLQFHTQFKYFHIAAAVQKLPSLDMESSQNMQQRFSHLANLLASGLSSVSRLFDAHQAAGCLAALCSPRCLPPLRHGPLLRLLLVLLENDGAKMRDLHSYELAQCAAAAAAMQDATRREQKVPLPPQQQAPQLPQQQQRQLAEGTSGDELSVASASLTAQGSSSDSGALALLDPLQRFWQLLHDVTLPQLSTFSVDSLALTALSFASAGRGSKALLLGAGNSGLARPHKWADSPVAVSRMLKALLLSADTHQENLLAVLATAVAANTRSFSPTQLAGAAAAFASIQFYHEPALQAVCRAAARSLKQWPARDVVTLLESLEALRFCGQGFMKAATKALTAAAEQADMPPAAAGARAPQLGTEQLVNSVAALLQLGFSGEQLQGLVAATVNQVLRTVPDPSSSSHSSHSVLLPSTAVKLLWAVAVLEESAARILPSLLSAVGAAAPGSLTQRELRLLHQAHRLLVKDWVSGHHASSSAPDSEQQQQQQAWQAVRGLLKKAQAAAAAHAAASASRGKQHVQAVQEAFCDLGFEAPVPGFRVDGGALQPDLAFVTGGSSSSSSRSSSSDPAVKFALMCDHVGRFSRNAPHELLGYWRVAGWLLEADGWRVVRLPAHEWQVLLQDRDAHSASALSYVYNALVAAGVKL